MARWTSGAIQACYWHYTSRSSRPSCQQWRKLWKKMEFLQPDSQWQINLEAAIEKEQSDLLKKALNQEQADSSYSITADVSKDNDVAKFLWRMLFTCLLQHYANADKSMIRLMNQKQLNLEEYLKKIFLEDILRRNKISLLSLWNIVRYNRKINLNVSLLQTIMISNALNPKFQVPHYHSVLVYWKFD